MTTTAHEDQFTPSTQTIEIVHAPYEPVAILKRNVAELELALKRQTERAEKAEGELAELQATLAKLREQKPVAHIDYWKSDGTLIARRQETSGGKLYVAPVPAPHKGATHCGDCGLTWLDDGLNPLGCPYCKVSAPAPAVPAEWREAMQEAHDTFQRYADLHWAKDTRDSHEKAKVNQKLANKLYALLQSAEVRHD